MLKAALAICLVAATPAAAYDLGDYNNGGYLSRPFDSPMPNQQRWNPELSQPDSYRVPQSYGSIGKTPPPSYQRCVRDVYNGALVCY